MFVRFQERNNDGRRPDFVWADLVYTTGRRRHWRIGSDGVELQPYRLVVSLIENRRVDGKVRQEHIANVAAIDGHLLSGFYAGVDPAVVNATLAGRDGSGMQRWYQASVRARADFWCDVHDVLSRLSNRVDADAAAKIVLAINARVPTLTSDEAAALQQWADDREVESWKELGAYLAVMTEWSQKQAEVFEKLSREAREEVALFRSTGEGALQAVELAQRAIQAGDRETLAGLREARQQTQVSVLQIAAKKASGPKLR